MNEQMKHVFEISGLGKAPFYLSAPDESNSCFFCEHCGTILKNRYFIKSSDGKVSVVGIDCLNKTGDQGLIDNVKREKKIQREAQKNEIFEAGKKVREEKEIAAFGKTKEVRMEEISKEIQDMKNEIENLLNEKGFYSELIKSDFGCSMIKSMVNVEMPTDNMKNVIKSILIKSKSGGARKGSDKYKHFSISVEKDLTDFYVNFSVFIHKKEQLINERNNLIYFK